MARADLKVSILVEHPPWRTAWPALAREVRAFVASIAARRDLPDAAKGELAVVFADDARLKTLNARFRGKDRPTNVLSFPDSAVPPGGMALAYETVRREAAAQKKDFVHHAKHMILHGFLHLLGHDHRTAREARLMERLEIAILSDMGIPNPYSIRTKTRA